MKFLILATLCFSATLGRPQEGEVAESDPHFALTPEMKARHEMIVIATCLVERYDDDLTHDENKPKVKLCLDTVHEIEDPLSEEGLPKMKAFVTLFWPTIEEKCAAEKEAVQVKDAASAEAFMDCVETSHKNEVVSRCLAKSAADDVNESLTEGTVCVMDKVKMVKHIVRTVQKYWAGEIADLDGEMDDDHSEVNEEEKGLKMEMKQLMHHLYCERANDNEDAWPACKTCFDDAFALYDKESGNHAEVLAAGAKCSSQHLQPLYASCQNGLEKLSNVKEHDELKKSKKPVMQCFHKTTVRTVVNECAPEAAETSFEVLKETVMCSKNKLKVWINDNASPELAAFIVKSMGHDDEEENEVDVDGE